MKKINYLSIIFLISSLTLVSNYKVFISNVNQFNIVQSIGSGTINKLEAEYLKRITTEYPTLSSTVIPLKSIIGTYWVQNDSITKGLKLLEQGNLDNPFLGFSDAMIASTYDAIGVIDSFKYYSRKASKKLPNAPQHYVLMARTFVLENKLDSLKLLYNQIKNRVNDTQIPKIYLAAVLEDRGNLDSIEVLNDAKEIKSRFPFARDLNLLADYFIFGEEKVKQIIDFRQSAIDSFNVDPQKSIQNMRNVIDSQENSIPDYEMLIEMLFTIKDFKEVVTTYEVLQEKKMTTLRAFIVEFVSIAYVNTGNLQGGCLLANDLNNVGYNLSSSLARACQIN